MNDSPQASPAEAPKELVVRHPQEVLGRPAFDGPVIEPKDFFDLHGRHIVQNVVVEGGKPTNLLRYTIISRFVIDMPDGRTLQRDVTCPMNGFKGGRKQAFELHDKYLEEYRVVFEKNAREEYARMMAAREAAKLATAGADAAQARPKILGADGQKASGGPAIEVPAHDPTLAERHVPKDGVAKKAIQTP